MRMAFVGERGIALPIALGIGLVLLIMVAGAMTFAMSGLRKSGGDADSAAASAAAYAGVEEYRSRLAADARYQRYGNDASAFSRATGSTVSLPVAPDVNPAFGLGESGTWAKVNDSTKAEFRYEVDNSNFGSSGILRLRSTGRVGDSVRTVIANLKAKGFIDFLYFTDYEVQDPMLSLNSDGTPKCKNLTYEWTPVTPATPARTGCTGITFDRGDQINGPAHSNDTMHICQATFTGAVTSSDPRPPHYSPSTATNATGGGGGSCSGQVFSPDPNKKPKLDSSVGMPQTNTEMQLQTRIDTPDAEPRPGCQYTGPTWIRLNADGTMTVRSPWTKFTHAGTETVGAGVTRPNCGTPGLVGLGSTTGQTVPIPDNNLIFVQGVPASSPDPNYWGSTLPSGYSCTRSDGSGSNNGNGIGFPWVGPVGGNTRVEKATYGCKDGDIFLEGTLKGRLTVAAANSVYIVADVKYAGGVSTNTDMLGIVAGKPVWVWNPAWDDGGDLRLMKTDTAGRTIHAAILSVSNTFAVQNYNVGSSRGTLTVYGAIAQKYRGIVSSSGGYVKSYNYDERLKRTAPPKFLAPVSTTYGVTTMADVAPAFKADGTIVPLP